MARLVCGNGVNDTKEPTHIAGKMNPYYQRWSNMLHRCNPKRWVTNPAYTGTKICEEWIQFSIFKQWMQIQEHQFGENNIQIRQLDKDYLGRSSKLYSPDTCCFILKNTNLFITDSKSTQGNLPIGVNRSAKVGKFISRLWVDGTQEYLGSFNDPWEAHLAWLYRKRELAEVIARNELDSRVVNAILAHYHEDPFLY